LKLSEPKVLIQFFPRFHISDMENKIFTIILVLSLGFL